MASLRKTSVLLIASLAVLPAAGASGYDVMLDGTNFIDTLGPQQAPVTKDDMTTISTALANSFFDNTKWKPTMGVDLGKCIMAPGRSRQQASHSPLCWPAWPSS